MIHCLDKKPLQGLSLQQVKDFLRVSHGEDDALLETLLAAAVESLEHYLERSLEIQTFCFSFAPNPFTNSGVALNQYPYKILPGRMVLKMPYAPLVSVEEVSFLGEGHEPKLLPLQKVSLHKTGLLILELPWAKELKVTFKAGYETLPATLKVALLKCVAAYYEQGGEARDFFASPEMKALVLPYKKRRL